MAHLRRLCRIHASTAIIFFIALLSTESKAFAAKGASSPPTSSSLSISPLNNKPLTCIRGYDCHNTSSRLSSKRTHDSKTIRQTLTKLRAGASSDNVSSTNTIPPPKPPTNLALLKFYFPCLALWISGPLLSLVDTSFIGLSAKAGAVGAAGSAAQLAALGPATTFIDGSLYLFAFLNVATTNLYASALARGTSEKKNKLGLDELPGEGVVRTAAKTSLYSGIGLMFFLLAVARPLIALYIGKFSFVFEFRKEVKECHSTKMILRTLYSHILLSYLTSHHVCDFNSLHTSLCLMYLTIYI